MDKFFLEEGIFFVHIMLADVHENGLSLAFAKPFRNNREVVESCWKQHAAFLENSELIKYASKGLKHTN